jgi:hypothetical protein
VRAWRPLVAACTYGYNEIDQSDLAEIPLRLHVFAIP